MNQPVNQNSDQTILTEQEYYSLIVEIPNIIRSHIRRYQIEVDALFPWNRIDRIVASMKATGADYSTADLVMQHILGMISRNELTVGGFHLLIDIRGVPDRQMSAYVEASTTEDRELIKTLEDIVEPIALSMFLQVRKSKVRKQSIVGTTISLSAVIELEENMRVYAEMVLNILTQAQKVKSDLTKQLAETAIPVAFDGKTPALDGWLYDIDHPLYPVDHPLFPKK